VVVPRLTAGWVVLVEGRKWAVYPIPPYEEQARSGETVKDVRRRSHHASGARSVLDRLVSGGRRGKGAGVGGPFLVIGEKNGVTA
jgi:hypothetical protein